MSSGRVKTKITVFTINVLLLSMLPIQPVQALPIPSPNVSYQSDSFKILNANLTKDNTSAEKALTVINSGNESFSDFAAAGVKRQIKGNKEKYDLAIAYAVGIKGLSLSLSEVQNVIDSVNTKVAADALDAVNSGTEIFDDFASAGVTKAIKANKADYDSAIAAALKTKKSSLSLFEVQNTVDSVNTTVVATALSEINSGTELFEDFAKAGITKVVKANKDKYDTAIADARENKGLNLNLIELQNTVNSVNAAVVAAALTAINKGTEDISDFAAAGVWRAAKANKVSYDSAISDALTAKGSNLTAAEVQKNVDSVNKVAAANALMVINRGTEEFSNFAAAGITKAVQANKAGYDSAIAADRVKKGSDLTLAEMQNVIESVNAASAAAALTAINTGSEEFVDFSAAGVTKVSKAHKSDYDSAIAAAVKRKGASLSLAEVQDTVDKVNTAVAEDALTAINSGAESFSDFAAAGITKAVQANKDRYDLAIATARKEAYSILSRADVQGIVEEVNRMSPSTALLAINTGSESFTDFAIVGIRNANSRNKKQYDTAIQAAKIPNGPPLTVADVQKQVDIVNAAAAEIALKSINKGTRDFADYEIAGVKGAIGGLKRYYDGSVKTAVNQKGANLTLQDVQMAVDIINTRAASALSALNGGTDSYSDFLNAGVTSVIEADKASYDTAIAAALKAKGSNLTLAEVQKVVDGVNVPLRLQFINNGTEEFSDFALVGIKGAVGKYKGNYDKVIAAAKLVKGSDLLLGEIQSLIDDVNKKLTYSKTVQ
ncbi:hypothetical protein DEAC_c21520 [Desulfosporosinus acididurans]|uniref:Uncharacterized protein n=1 Tax=Desulfosporosinus acididurans TaxID=476652 RepID=A0A0J1FT17_9FIRM|nr:hypothetical protein [Desulfosporosinus acididurans]KLU66113.1 hypothetical protein DEAC_c21520 [Desulfosporosinus acididurans]